MVKFLKILISILPLFLLSCNQKTETINTISKDTEIPVFDNSEKKYTQLYDIIYINFAIEKGQHEKGLVLFLRDIHLMTDSELFHKMARISMQLHRMKDTAIIVDRWLELKPNNLLAHNIGISASLEEGDFMKASLIFNNSLNLIDSNDKLYYSRLMGTLSENNNRSNVIKFFDRHLEKKNNRLLVESLIELLHLYNQNTKVLEYIDKIGTHNDRTLIRYKASSLSAINQNEKAIKLLTDYLQTKKNKDRQVQFELINLYILSGNSRDAEVLIKNILEIDPENLELVFQIGTQCYNSGAVDLAGKYFSHLLSINFMSRDANYFLGLIDYDNGNYIEAVRHFEKVTGGDRKFESQIRKSSAIAKGLSLSQAIEFLESLKTQYTSNVIKVNILLTEISLYNEEKKYTKIINLVNNSKTKYPNNLRLIYARAMAYESMRKIDLMEQDLKYILSINSNSANTLNALGYSLTIHTDRYIEAEKYIREALEYDPGNAAILDSLGWVLYKKGEIKNALHYIELAYNKDQNPEIVEHFCEILIKNGLYEKSRKVMKIEIEKNPNNTSLLNNLIILHGDEPL